MFKNKIKILLMTPKLFASGVNMSRKSYSCFLWDQKVFFYQSNVLSLRLLTRFRRTFAYPLPGVGISMCIGLCTNIAHIPLLGSVYTLFCAVLCFWSQQFYLHSSPNMLVLVIDKIYHISHSCKTFSLDWRIILNLLTDFSITNFCNAIKVLRVDRCPVSTFLDQFISEVCPGS